MGNEPNKPNFLNAQSGVGSTAPNPPPKAGFGNINSGVASTVPVAKTYAVVSGDSLSKIAKHVYGDANR